MNGNINQKLEYFNDLLKKNECGKKSMQGNFKRNKNYG